MFLELVEARTKLASVLPFCLGTLYALVRFHGLDPVNAALFFAAMLIFDMTTTAINNLMDYHKAKDATYRQTVNIIGRAHLKPTRVAAMIFAMLAVATGLSLVLVARTDWFLLLLGGACFTIGIFYTFGPLPLSRLPLGEVFSGVTMGLGIPFIAVYVNVPAAQFLQVSLAWPQLAVTGSVPNLVGLGLLCVTPMATIANVMLANNLADLDQDVANHRLTLPMYLGRRNASWLYQGLAVIGFLAVPLGVALRLLPGWGLVNLAVAPLVWRNARRFVGHPDKATTFGTAIQNLVLANGSLIVGLALAVGVGA